MKKFKNAILLTGAAARIPQEVAIFDKLQERSTNSLQISESDTILVGFSSGSLNLAGLNACFREKNPLKWKEYYQEEVLFPLKNSDVYVKKNPPLIPFFNTDSFRETLNRFLEKTEMNHVKDLGFHSYILTQLSRKGKDKKHHIDRETLWACSKNVLQEYLSLSDVLMASTAIPIVFPSQEIHCETGHETDFPEREYHDGGTKGTFDNFEEYLGKLIIEKGQLEELYIISPRREKSNEDISETKKSIAERFGDIEHELLKDLLSVITMRTFLKFLVKLQEWGETNFPIAQNIYVCIPEMENSYKILDFEKGEEQYNEVKEWFSAHPEKLAVPLNEYIQRHEHHLA